MKAERVVVDTNVLISAALNAAGVPRTSINAVLSAQNRVPLFSDETFSDLDSGGISQAPTAVLTSFLRFTQSYFSATESSFV